jgi:hypothetical protein
LLIFHTFDIFLLQANHQSHFLFALDLVSQLHVCFEIFVSADLALGSLVSSFIRWLDSSLSVISGGHMYNQIKLACSHFVIIFVEDNMEERKGVMDKT